MVKLLRDVILIEESIGVYDMNKKRLVEEGLKRFNESREFQRLFEWLLEEHEKTVILSYQIWLKEQILKKYKFAEVACGETDLKFVLSLLSTGKTK